VDNGGWPRVGVERGWLPFLRQVSFFEAAFGELVVFELIFAVARFAAEVELVNRGFLPACAVTNPNQGLLAARALS